MQQRSGQHYLQAKQRVHRHGQARARSRSRAPGGTATRYHLRKAPGVASAASPSNLDWARFLGPLKWRDYDPQQYFNWRAYLDFGGGQVTDLFTHWIDVVHMFMGKDIPTSAVGRRRRLPLQGRPHRAGHHQRAARIPGRVHRDLRGHAGAGHHAATAIEICGTEGRLWIDRSRFEFYPVAQRRAADGGEGLRATSTCDHVQNFLDCVRSRKLPNGDVLIGHRSAQASHLGNIAYMQKRRIDFDPVREEILPF